MYIDERLERALIDLAIPLIALLSIEAQKKIKDEKDTRCNIRLSSGHSSSSPLNGEISGFNCSTGCCSIVTTYSIAFHVA